MSLWQFHACIAGWNKANGGEKVTAPSDDEFRQMKYDAAAQEARALAKGDA